MNPGNAWRRQGADGAGGTIACSTYLSRHSDYLDGELNAAEALAHEAHEGVCASCARYAGVLRRGSALLKDLPEVQPSADFQQRLQHRIFHVQDQGSLGGERRRAGWLAAAAGVVLLAGGGFFILPRADRPEQQRVAVADPAGRAVFQLASWATPAAPPAMPKAALPPAIAGYSPVVVRPPLYRPASYELLAGE